MAWALVIAAALLYCAVICGRYLWQRVSVALFPAVLSTLAQGRGYSCYFPLLYCHLWQKSMAEILWLCSLLCCHLWLEALVIASPLLCRAVICDRYLWQRASVALLSAVLSSVAKIYGREPL